MKENFLQDIWRNKRFKNINFKDIEGNSLEVLDFGIFNSNSGPDFLNARIKINHITLFGNIEIHVRSSDWLLHHHQKSDEYKTIILHVVYHHDKNILDIDAAGIPTLELKNCIDVNKIWNKNCKFIACEDFFQKDKIDVDFKKELILEKLEQKSLDIEESLKQTKNDYEAVLFERLAYAFGLKINSEIFLEIAKNIDFSIIKKITQNQLQLESLLLGKAGLLKNKKDAELWQKEYDYLKTKYALSNIFFRAKFLRLRPANFPTVRLSQLAFLYNIHPKLFSKILEADSINDFYLLFQNVTASKYWKNHYVFDKISKISKDKKLSEKFIHLLIINAILPLLYTYHRKLDPEKIDFVLELYRKISAEENSIIENFKELEVNFDNALDSQSFLYLKKQYCNNKKCTECSLFPF